MKDTNLTRRQLAGMDTYRSGVNINLAAQSVRENDRALAATRKLMKASREMAEAHQQNGFCVGMRVRHKETGEVFTIEEVRPRALVLVGKKGPYRPDLFEKL